MWVASSLSNKLETGSATLHVCSELELKNILKAYTACCKTWKFHSGLNRSKMLGLWGVLISLFHID